MGRPSKLSPSQWADIERRIQQGEGVRDLAKEYGVSPGAISQKGFSKQAKQVQEVAAQLAAAQNAVAAMPVRQQYHVISLAEKLRNISHSLASSAELGAKNSYRLNALANEELQKVEDGAILDEGESFKALKTVAVLTKMANEAAVIPSNLLSANKGAVQPQEPDPDAPPTSGVLVVPGLAPSSEAWSKQQRGAKA